VDWLSKYERYTSLLRHEAINDYHTWVGISTIASALERKVFLRVSTELFYPNMFIVLVAPPGIARKGGAIKLAHPFLDSLEQHINVKRGKSTKEALFRILANCATTTSMGYLHSSLTVINTELSTMLNRKDENLPQNLCQMFDGEDKADDDTISRGTVHIQGVWLNLLGGTVPPGFTKALDKDVITGGLGSRMIFIYADDIRWENLECLESKETEQLKEELITDLSRINQLEGEYLLTANSLALYKAWYSEINRKIRTHNNPEYLTSFYVRCHTHVGKLAIILTASKGQEKIIRKETLARAILYIESTCKYLPFVFSGIGRSIDAASITTVLTQIKIAGDIGIERAELLLLVCYDVDLEGFERVIKTLASTDVISIIRKGVLKDKLYFYYNNKKGANPNATE